MFEFSILKITINPGQVFIFRLKQIFKSIDVLLFYIRNVLLHARQF